MNGQNERVEGATGGSQADQRPVRTDTEQAEASTATEARAESDRPPAYADQDALFTTAWNSKLPSSVDSDDEDADLMVDDEENGRTPTAPMEHLLEVNGALADDMESVPVIQVNSRSSSVHEETHAAQQVSEELHSYPSHNEFDPIIRKTDRPDRKMSPIKRENGAGLIALDAGSTCTISDVNSFLETLQNDKLAMKRIERVAKKISPCSGEKEAEVREWLKAIEYSGLPCEFNVQLAYETARGKLYRELVRSKPKSWPSLRQLVQETFLAHNYTALCKRALQQVRQDPRESLRSFNIRFKELVDEAYPLLQTYADEENIVNCYLKALASDNVVDRGVLAEGEVPSTLKEAMEASLKYEKIDEIKRAAGRIPRADRIQVLRQEKPRESTDDSNECLRQELAQKLNHVNAKLEAFEERVDMMNDEIIRQLKTCVIGQSEVASRSPSPRTREVPVCRHCNRRGHGEANCWSKFPHLRPEREKTPVPGLRPQRPLQWTEDGRPICLKCNRAGHMRRQCHMNQMNEDESNGNGLNYRSRSPSPKN